MKSSYRWLAFLTATIVIDNAWCYEDQMHEEMSRRAVESSKLARTDLLRSWGLSGSTETLIFRSSEGREDSIAGWVLFGAIAEDEFGRPLNHFFDPVRDSGLAEELSDFQTTLGYTTVISNMRGMRVMPNAVNLRVDATDTGSCPGY